MVDATNLRHCRVWLLLAQRLSCGFRLSHEADRCAVDINHDTVLLALVTGFPVQHVIRVVEIITRGHWVDNEMLIRHTHYHQCELRQLVIGKCSLNLCFPHFSGVAQHILYRAGTTERVGLRVGTAVVITHGNEESAEIHTLCSQFGEYQV